jgi:DNA-binding response OmpR family regulator
MASPSILIVDDDANIRALLRMYLERERYRVLDAADGASALRLASEHRFDLVLLDVMLPGLDGMEVCRILRERSDVTIVLITARSGDSDKVVGLDLGADDYVVKPFSPRELMARVRAHLRRRLPKRGDEPALAADGLVLDPVTVQVKISGRVVPLTNTEFRLLHALMRRPMRVFTRDELLDELHALDDSGVTDRTVDVHIGRLRRKLADEAAMPRFVNTVRGVGYSFAQPVERLSSEVSP